MPCQDAVVALGDAALGGGRRRALPAPRGSPARSAGTAPAGWSRRRRAGRPRAARRCARAWATPGVVEPDARASDRRARPRCWPWCGRVAPGSPLPRAQTPTGHYRVPVIVDSALYRKGQRIEVDCFPHEFDKLRAEATEDGDFVWVGLYKPSEGELDDVAESFGLHPLAVEDALKAHQRPKLERYDDSLFLTLKTLWYVDARGRRRDRRDQPVRRARLRDHGPARPRLRAALGALPARGPGGRAHPRPVRGDLRGLRHGRRRLHRRGRRARGRRRRDRGLGLLPRPHQRLDPHLRAQARDRRGAPGRAAAARADAEVRRRAGARRRARGRAVLPRRPRPPQPGRRGRGQPRLAALHRLRRPPGPDHRPAERRHAEDLGRGRAGRRADADRRRLRHELRPHARAGLGARLPVRAAADGRRLGALWVLFKKSGWL